MKISIIMCVLNSMPYIVSSVESFRRQKYKTKELIIVHSKSKDNTQYYLDSIKDKNIKKFNYNGSIYKALNFGISKAKGKVIGVLHSDDIFFCPNTLDQVISKFKEKNTDIVYGNILFSKKNNLLNIVRIWNNINISNNYEIPPHTGTFIKKKVYKMIKYNESYKISADTDFLIKIFKKKLRSSYLKKYITIMRTGGLSTNIFFFIKKAKEDLKIYKVHNLTFFDYFLKLFSKKKQIFSNKYLKKTKYQRVLNDLSN